MKRIVLASTSPRRIALIKKVAENAEVISPSYKEGKYKHLKPEHLVKLLAQGKARAVAKNIGDVVVVGADTIVEYRGVVLGKPKNQAEAKRMLEMLSGKINYVLTGLAVVDPATGKIFSHVEKIKVLFKKLSPEDIKWYIQTGEPMDKAGAYAIWNKRIVKKFEGDKDAAAGLPVKALKDILRKLKKL